MLILELLTMHFGTAAVFVIKILTLFKLAPAML